MAKNDGKGAFDDLANDLATFQQKPVSPGDKQNLSKPIKIITKEMIHSESIILGKSFKIENKFNYFLED